MSSPELVKTQPWPPTPYGMGVVLPGPYTQTSNTRVVTGDPSPPPPYQATGANGQPVPEVDGEPASYGTGPSSTAAAAANPPIPYGTPNQTSLSQPTEPIYLFRINTQTVDRYSWLQPNRTTLAGNEVFTEESELAATRSTWLTSLFPGVEHIARKNGNYIRAYGAKATYLKETYVTGSINDVLIQVPDVGFVGPSQDLGPNWVVQAGSFTVNEANQVTSDPLTASAATYLGVTTKNLTLGVYVNLNVMVNPSVVGLIARNQDATDIDNCYELLLVAPPWTIGIDKIVAGVRTNLVAVSLPVTNSGLLEFDLNGTTLTAYLNNTLVAQITDSTFTTAGGFGIVDEAVGGKFSDFTLTY